MPRVTSPPMSLAPKITLQGIHQVFSGRSIIKDLDLVIAPTEFLVILGPSGCGKSTLLRLIAGLISPTAGSIDITPSEGDIGFVFQDASLLPWRTALENVLLPLELQGLARAEAEREALQLLDDVGLAAVSNHYPDALSGGMKMRVSIARALAGNPALLLLDEPFAALDEGTRARLDQHLATLTRKRAITTLFVTHSIHEALELADRIIVLSPADGKILHDERLDRKELDAEAMKALSARLSARLEAEDKAR